MSGFLLPHLAKAEPYHPGEQWTGATIKLNTNESPYPPSPRVFEAIEKAAGRLNRYPQADADDARAALAKNRNLPVNHIFVGNGSDEVLRMVFQAYVAPGDRVAWSTPTYTLYEVLAGFADARVIDVPRNEAFEIPIRQLASVAAKLTLIANPNAPTGTLTPLEDLRLIAESGNLLLIDEAYADFAGTTATELVKEFENVIVVRTLSKSYGLAGLRVGFAIACPAIIDDFMRLKDSYNVSMIGNAAAAAAIADDAHVREITRKIVATRTRLEKRLTELGFLVHKSGTNFVFAVPPSRDGRRLYETLRDQGILVRWFKDDPRISVGVRITVGTDDEIDRLLEVIGADGR